MTQAAFIAVVGPSGAGKDTLMAEIARERPDIACARRVIAPPRPDIGETFDAVSDAEFDRRVASGRFLLHWGAHGKRYAIPIETREILAGGTPVLGNISRGSVDVLTAKVARVVVLYITAPLEIRAARLSGRGRETSDDIRERLARAGDAIPVAPNVHVIDNGGVLEHTLRAALAALPRATETRR